MIDSHVQKRLVFLKLKPDPSRLTVAVSMVFGKNSLGLFALVVDVEPTRRLGDEPSEEDNQAGEEHLKVDGDGPADVAIKRDSTSDGTGGQDGAGKPKGVAVRSEDAA